MKLIRLLTFFYIVICSALSFSAEKKELVKTGPFLLGDLIPIYVSATSDVAKIPTDELIKSYKDLLTKVDDPKLVADMNARISQLELLLQDQLVAKAEDAGGEVYVADYSVSIKEFESTLARFPDLEGNDGIYYQLAKAYDLSGQGNMALQALTNLIEKYPQSTYFVEAQFRRGDLLFSLGKFDAASRAYQAVLDNGKDTIFLENAIYMHGWSMFKLNQYEGALSSFTIVLDRTMPENGRLDGVEPSKASLVDDTLRVMGIIFSYMSGGKTINETYTGLGRRPYESLLYEQLGELYVTQERYKDAIETFKGYIDRNPTSENAPFMHNKVLRTMQLAKFYNLAFTEKESFISTYDVEGEYFLGASEELKEYLRQYLYVYIDEVARFYHSRAQKTKAKIIANEKVTPIQQKEMLKDYITANLFYKRFVDAFPEDLHTPEKVFMMGEVHTELNEFEEAIKSYEKTAYEYGINDFSEESAYASILTYKKIVKNELDPEKRSLLIKRKLDAQLIFTEKYAFSEHSRPVMLDTIDILYEEKEFERVVEQSEAFLALVPPPTKAEELGIALVMGHSEFELKNYVAAEKSYQRSYNLMESGDARRVELIDRIAASIYKNAESLYAEDKKLEAIDEFLRVAKAAPTSQFVKNAEYDAATYLLQEKLWDRALLVLAPYRKKYDENGGDLDITSKFLAAYEGLKRFDLAADELLKVSKLTDDPDKRRQALFLAAEYYEKSKNIPRALAEYQTYLNQYPEPFDLAMETRYKLSEMYKKLKDDVNYKIWLDALIKFDEEAGDLRTDRSKYLAAYARNIYVKDYREAFEVIKLNIPLKVSLGLKKEALSIALDRYQQILDYGVQEFATQATYYVANIYAKLSSDLIDSERPAELNELELEQYTLLLEEQADPFTENAIQVHESNVENGRNGNYDGWVAKSIDALAKLLPGRYNKKEAEAGYINVIN